MKPEPAFRALIALPALVALVSAGASVAPASAQDVTDPAASEPWDIKARSSYAERDAGGANIFGFVDDVVILHGELVAYADRATYLGGPRRALLSGHVRMLQDSTVVMGPTAYYDRDLGVARFPNGIYIERPSGTAVADEGIWWRRQERFELKGQVSAADTLGTLEGETVSYDLRRELFWVVGDARLVDDESGAIVEAQDLRYDRFRAIATATGQPSVTFIDEEDAEMRVTAVTLTYDPGRNVAVAKEDVRIERLTMEARAGLAQYWRDEGRLVLTESPEIVDGTTSMAGDRIELVSQAGGNRTVRVIGGARVSNQFVSSRSRPAAGEDPEDPGAPAAPDAEARENLETLRRAREDAALRGEKIRDAEPDPSAPPAPEDVPDIAPGPRAEEQVERSLAAATTRTKERGRPAADGEPGAEGEDEGEGEGEGEGEEEEGERLPPWITVPSEELPAENLLFGDEIVIHFVNDEIDRVDVVGHGRSKFFPNEELGDLTEWNDVTGDTLRVWFGASEVESVLVRGEAVGEYRMPAGEHEGSSRDVLKEKGKLIEYEAPVIRYRRAAETMLLEQGAQVRYQSLVLTSGEVELDAQKGVMTASGEPGPQLVDNATEIQGENMRYHLDSEKGEIIEGKTKFDNAYYHGEDIWKLGEEEMAVSRGWFTTCALDHPHYHFESKQMKIYLDDKVVAKPVVFRIRNIPVMILPYYMASLKKGRQSGFLLPNLELGVDDSRGRFIRNMGYYWAPSDYYDAKLTFDFYPQQDRLVTRLDNRYAVRYRFDGNVNLLYNRDVPANRKEYSLRFAHRQTFSETLTLTGDGTFVSNEDIFINTDDVDRLQRDLSSRLTLTKRFRDSNQSVILQVTQNRNLDTGFIRETLPQIDYNLPSRSIRKAPAAGASRADRLLNSIFFSLSAQGLHERQERVVADSTVEDRNVGAFAGTSVRSTAQIADWVRLTPSASGNLSWVDEDRFGARNAVRATYRTSVSATSDVYGLFPYRVGPLDGFRHVFTPNASWNWAPEFPEYFSTDSTGIPIDRFEPFGRIGSTPRKTNSMSFSLRNLLQTKMTRGGQERRYDLFTLSNSITYDRLARDAGRRSLSNLSSALVVLSALPVNQTWSVSHDPYSWALLSSSVTTRARISSATLRRNAEGGNPFEGSEGVEGNPQEVGGIGAILGLTGGIGEWNIDASHTYRKSRNAEPSSSLDVRTRWTPTPNWGLSFDTQYDLQTGQNTGQRWSVHRKIHCWELSFDRRLLGREWQYYFRINITDLPDLKAERARGLTGSSSSLGTSGFFPSG